MRLQGNPCKECEERHLGCHSDCEKYLKAVEKTEAIKKEIRQDTILRAEQAERSLRIRNGLRHR